MPFTIWIICSSVILNFSRVLRPRKVNLKNITNSRPKAKNLQKIFSTHFSWPHYPGKFKITLEQIFLTVGQNNFGNKIPFPDRVDPASLLCSFSIQTNIYRKVLMGWILVWSNRLENRFKPHRLVFSNIHICTAKGHINICTKISLIYKTSYFARQKTHKNPAKNM